MLHGVGLDGSDLFRFAPQFHALLPGAHISAPHAPSRFDLGRTGRPWFSLQGMGPNTRLNGVRAAAPVVERFIDARLAKTAVPTHRVILCGFSQGAMIALYVGLRRETPPAAIIAHSGMVVDQALLPGEIRSRPPVLLTHGDA
ncbi:MAG TPA: phospholipase, partial [Rhodospirillales bacterium]|nr:phospholipase [Rhodospirillales bacterium]